MGVTNPVLHRNALSYAPTRDYLEENEEVETRRRKRIRMKMMRRRRNLEQALLTSDLHENSLRPYYISPFLPESLQDYLNHRRNLTLILQECNSAYNIETIVRMIFSLLSLHVIPDTFKIALFSCHFLGEKLPKDSKLFSGNITKPSNSHQLIT